MKKSLLLGVAAALALSASAEKSYVQISSGHQLAEGAKYVVGSVNSNTSAAANFPRFYDMSSANKVVQTIKQDTDFPASMVWTLHKISDINCACDASGHVDQSPVFVMEQNGKAIVNSGSSDSLSISEDEIYPTTTYVEFIPKTGISGFDNETLFVIHYDYNTSGNKFQAIRAMGTGTNKFNRYSDVNNGNNLIQVVSNNATWSSVNRVYLEIDTDNPAEAAHSYWSLVCAERSAWASEISDELVNIIKNLPFPENVEWDATTLQAQAEAAFPAAFAAATSQYFIGKSITFKNTDSSKYLTHASGNNNITPLDGLSNAAEWVIEAGDNGGFLIKEGNGNRYLTIPSSTGTVMTLTDNKANAGEFGLVIANLARKSTYIRAYNALTTLNQCHANGTTALKWVGSDATGPKSQFSINIFPAFEALYSEIQAERDAYIPQIQALSGYSVFTDNEISTAVTALNAISFENLEETDAAVAAKQAEVDAAMTQLWSKYANTPVLIKFYRLNTYVSYNNHNATGVQEFFANAVLQIQHTTGMNVRLHSINSNANITQGASDEWNFITGSNNTHGEVPSANWIALKNTTKTGNNVLHKANTSNNGFMWYNANDQGSAIEVISDSDAIISFLSTYESQLTNNGEPGKYTDQEKYNAISAAIEALTTINNEALTNLQTLYDQYQASLATPSGYFTISASPNNGVSLTQNNRAIFYSTTTTTSGGNTVTTFLPANKTVANSIWYYADNNLSNYSNGLYVKSNNFLAFNTEANNNTPTEVNFVSGYQEPGTYQMIHDTNRNVHLASSGEGIMANACRINGVQNESAHNLTLTRVAELPVTIHSDGFGSIVSPLPLSAPAGATTYVAKIDDSKLSFTAVEAAGMVIAPNSHILIKGTPGVTINVPVAYGVSEYSYTPGTHNQLSGSHVARQIAAETDMNYYAKAEAPAASAASIMLLTDDADTANFNKLPVENGMVTIPANTMVVTLPALSANTESLAIDPEGEPIATSISEISVESPAAQGAVYDLQGRRLSAPARGINIINGRKVMVK